MPEEKKGKQKEKAMYIPPPQKKRKKLGYFFARTIHFPNSRNVENMKIS